MNTYYTSTSTHGRKGSNETGARVGIYVNNTGYYIFGALLLIAFVAVVACLIVL